MLGSRAMKTVLIFLRGNQVERATRISFIVADVIVVTLTWVKTYEYVRNAMRFKVEFKVTAVLLRDGAPLQCYKKRQISFLIIFAIHNTGTIYFW